MMVLPGCTRHARRRLAFAGVVLLLALASACGSGTRTSEPAANGVSEPTLVFELPTLPSTTPTAEAAAETGQPAAPQFPRPNPAAQLARLVIPGARVNAPLQVKGVNGRREMENPDGKDTVAWYDFSEQPGFGGNAVFSGHVDWYTGERGVFWYLKDLKEGDAIALRLSDGMELTYRVTRSDVYKAETAPVGDIVGPTSTDTLTLITCEGVFSRSAQEYGDRRVVRAERTS